MNEQWLINHVLDTAESIPRSPDDGRVYLSLAEAEQIVDEALEYLGKHGEETEYTYMRGHRIRLMHALTMIPKSNDENRTLLDVGCYGYMAFWAARYLGYQRVVGIEWRPEDDSPIIHRELRVNGDAVEFESYNFDITSSDWPIDEHFDTVLFFEVLEHINEDPMGVMERIHARMSPNATLVMSVPNAISYKAFREFLVGMPPWTYWFYEPDLAHEPRHCFEYTPIVFRSLLIAAGMGINAMRTIYAYSSPEQEGETLEIAASFGYGQSELGETMIAQCVKSSEGVQLRYPDVLYSPDGYYKNIYPRLRQILSERIEHFREQLAPETLDTQVEAKPDDTGIAEHHIETPDQLGESKQRILELMQVCEQGLMQRNQLESEIERARSEQSVAIEDRDQHRAWANQLQTKNQKLEAQVKQLLFQSDCSLQQEQRLRAQLEEQTQNAAVARQETAETRAWADRLSRENAELRGQVNELLFACDCYLQQLGDPDHAVRVIRQRRFRWALDRSKAIARKTPVARTALRPVYRSAKRFIKRRI